MSSRFKPSFFSTLGLLGWVVVVMSISGCGATPKKKIETPIDQELETANRMARFAFDKGDVQQAAAAYRRALAQAYVRNDSQAILNARYNLAVCMMTLEHYSEALNLVDQALEALAASNEKIPADLLLLQATIFYRLDRMPDAWQVTQKILERSASLSSSTKARTHFLRGLIASHNEDPVGIRQSIDNMGQSESQTVASDQAELQGRLAMLEEKWNQAVVDLDQSIRLRRESRDYRRMAIALALSADACQAAGRTEAAASRFLQAGRSAALRDDRSRARQWLTQAALLFEQIGNQALRAEAQLLLSGLEDGSDPTPMNEEQSSAGGD
jgi:tetratricopeptide (TPR) repeat protein